MKKKNNGFTIIELIVASALFSMVMIITLASFLQIGRMFYKGVSITNTDESTRSIVENLTNDIRFAKGPPGAPKNAGNGGKYFCVGLHRYTYYLRTKVLKDDVGNKASHKGFWIENVGIGGNCPVPSDSETGTSPQELVGVDMQLNDFNLVCNTNHACSLGVHMVFYGADTTVLTPDINSPVAKCSAPLRSAQFCAVSDMRTVVLERG